MAKVGKGLFPPTDKTLNTVDFQPLHTPAPVPTWQFAVVQRKGVACKNSVVFQKGVSCGDGVRGTASLSNPTTRTVIKPSIAHRFQTGNLPGVIHRIESSCRTGTLQLKLSSIPLTFVVLSRRKRKTAVSNEASQIREASRKQSVVYRDWLLVVCGGWIEESVSFRV